MYSFIVDGDSCKLYYNNKIFQGWYLEYDNETRESNIYFFSNCEEGEERTSFEDICEMIINQIPKKLEFKLILADWNKNTNENQLRELFSPFNSIDLIIEDSVIYTKLSIVCGNWNWYKKWDYKIYSNEIINQAKNIQGLNIIKWGDITEEYCNFLIEIQDNSSITISESVQKSSLLIKQLVKITEKALRGPSLFHQALEIWRLYKDDNVKESFWQEFFTKYSWVISQCFSAPIMIFENEAFVGGTNISNKGAKIIDYTFKNKLSDNLVLFEIKKPSTELIGKLYRADIYSVSNELTGAIIQTLQYRDKCLKNYLSLFKESADDGKYFELFNPKCILIIGRLSSLDKNQRQSFELFRNSLSMIEIITYDELFTKIENLLDIYSNYIE